MKQCYIKKKSFLISILFITFFGISQNQEKEIVYLYFDASSNERYNVDVEGKGYQSINKYRKLKNENKGYLIICDEYFAYSTNKEYMEVCSLAAFEKFQFVELSYIQKKKAANVMRYNPFKKIYIVEKKSDNTILKYQVTWIDDWVMTKD